VPEPESLFEPVEGGWLPTAWARGPWSPDTLHGGPAAALLARTAEARGDDDGTEITWQPARLTVELLRPVPVAPLSVTATLTRPGRKVQVVDTGLRTAEGTVVASARLLRVRDADVPAPVSTGDQHPPPGPAQSSPSRPSVDTYDGFHNRGVEHRFAVGTFEEPGPASDWIRLAVPVVPGEEPSPLQRVAAAADFGNGISRVVDFGELQFINPDLTIHLHRLPIGEWVCLEAVTWMEARGLALAESRLWDEHGPLGRSLQSLLVDRRSP
jgi:hypothetical protein